MLWMSNVLFLFVVNCEICVLELYLKFLQLALLPLCVGLVRLVKLPYFKNYFTILEHSWWIESPQKEFMNKILQEAQAIRKPTKFSDLKWESDEDHAAPSPSKKNINKRNSFNAFYSASRRKASGGTSIWPIGTVSNINPYTRYGLNFHWNGQYSRTSSLHIKGTRTKITAV